MGVVYKRMQQPLLKISDRLYLQGRLVGAGRRSLWGHPDRCIERRVSLFTPDSGNLVVEP